MFAVTGIRTTIVGELSQITGETAVAIENVKVWPGPHVEPFKIPEDADRFVLAAGLLPGKRIDQISQNEALECCGVNLIQPIRLCELILERRPAARICVIGSWSTQGGSFDKLYAATKGGLHQYVQTRAVKSSQQLVAVAPTIIIDSGMTRRRPDFEGLEERRKTVRAIDVARVIFETLWSPHIRFQNSVLPVTLRRHP